MDKYLKEIGKTRLLTREEEREIAKRANAGDPVAREMLITRNLRYVVEVAKSYQGQGLPLEELIAEGNLGICKAVDKFDASRNIKFITYAVWWIRQSILQALSDNTRIVRIPVNKINEVQKARKRLEREEQSVGDRRGVTDFDEEIFDMYSAFPVRLNSDNINDQPILDLFADENAVMPDEGTELESLRIDIDIVMSSLDDREKEIIRYYNGLEKEESLTLEEIGNLLGLTRERIRQIKKKSLKKIKRNPRSKKILTKYL